MARSWAAIAMLCVSAAMHTAPAQAMNVRAQMLEEGLHCEGAAQSDALMPYPTKKTPLTPPRAIMRGTTDSYALVRIEIDATGRPTSSTLLFKTPQSADYEETVADVRDWKFQPGKPGAVCIGVALKWEYNELPVPPTRDPTIPAAPPPLATDPAPAFSPEAIAANLSCRVWVDIIMGEGGVPLATITAREEPADWSCGRLTSIAVYQWRFPPETPPGRYRLKLNIKA